MPNAQITRSDDMILGALARGVPQIVPTKEYRRLLLGTNGWFMWQGEMYDVSGKGVGGGLIRMSASNRYPVSPEGNKE